MHPEFESNLITHIFRKFGASGKTESDVIFALLEAPKEFYAVLSTMHAYQCAYSIHCTAYSLSMLIVSWNKIFYLLTNAFHHYYVADDVIIHANIAFSAVSRNKLSLHKQNIHFHQLLDDIMKIIQQYSKIL